METGVVRATGFGLGEMAAALEHAGERFVALLRSLKPAEADRPVPDMTWSVAETAAHMLTIVRRGMGDRRRADSLDGLAALNDDQIGEVADRDLATLADRLETDMTAYVQRLVRISDADANAATIHLHAGVRADIPTGVSYQLFDFLAHGLDIAGATDRPWAIPASEAALVLRASLPALAPWVEPDVLAGPRQRAAFALSGMDVGLEIIVGDQTYQVRPVDTDATEWEADPVEVFLAIGGRRAAQQEEVGRVAAWYRPI